MNNKTNTISKAKMEDFLENIRKKYSYKYNNKTLKRSFWPGCAIMLFHITIVMTSLAISLILYKLNFLIGLISSVFTVFFIATRYRALANILHECVHNCFTQKKHQNDILAKSICVILFISLKKYKDHHWAHHRYTGDYTQDLEFSSITHYNLHSKIERSQLKIHLQRMFLCKHLRHYISRTFYVKDDELFWKVLRVLYAISLLIGLLISIYFAYSIALYFILVGVLFPLFIIWPTITYVMDILDHGGLIGKEFNPVPARNYIINNRFLDFIFFPRNDTYHLVHHLFPGLSTDILPSCHKELIRHETEYAKLSHTFKELYTQYLEK